MLKVEVTSIWDENFFKRFVDFKNLIHKNIETSFPETISDYSKYFLPDSVFGEDFNWTAFMAIEGGRTQAQAILCWRKDGSLANLGFIDWLDDETAATTLINTVTEFARSKNLKSIKTPVDINFFIKYRIRLPSGDKPFYGEPVYPDYYHKLFKSTGFKQVGEWDTYRLNRIRTITNFFGKRKKLKEKVQKVSNLKTTIRDIRMNEWDKELRIIHDLFSEAYKTMPEYEPVSFPQFKLIYDDFRYIVQPWLSYIVELDGRPVAFSINFVDPLPVLSRLKGKKLNSVQKAIVFAKLRLNMGTLMIAHVGKIPGPNGEDIPGVQVQVSRRLSYFSVFMRKVIVSFQNIDSPSRRSWDPKLQIPYARYVLYGMDL